MTFDLVFFQSMGGHRLGGEGKDEIRLLDSKFWIMELQPGGASAPISVSEKSRERRRKSITKNGKKPLAARLYGGSSISREAGDL